MNDISCFEADLDVDLEYIIAITVRNEALRKFNIHQNRTLETRSCCLVSKIPVLFDMFKDRGLITMIPNKNKFFVKKIYFL